MVSILKREYNGITANMLLDEESAKIYYDGELLETIKKSVVDAIGDDIWILEHIMDSAVQIKLSKLSNEEIDYIQNNLLD